jgi:hypothetical protein
MNYNELLQDNGDLPKIRITGTEKQLKSTGGRRVIIAPALEYEGLMRKVPEGSLITSEILREILAHEYRADYTCPVTTRKFVVLVAMAAVERQDGSVPYWRTLKGNGELNKKFPGGIDEQVRLLEGEGHKVNKVLDKYYVEDYKDKLLKWL